MVRKANVVMWKQNIFNQKSSGLSQVKWCNENNVSIHTFRYWINRLKDRTPDTPEVSEWAPLRVDSLESNEIGNKAKMIYIITLNSYLISR